MRTVAIIQARMGSTRLPGKMTKDLGGQPVIAWVFERARRSRELADVWLATTVDPTDDVLAAWADEHGFPCYRGSVNDVLDRYYQAAQLASADVVVRLTADCPFIDPAVVDQVVTAYRKGSGAYAYVSNIHPPTYPDGLDTEVFNFAALERAWKEATLSSEREHVTPYLWKNPDLFPAYNVVGPTDLSTERWTLDTPDDLEFLRQVVAGLGSDAIEANLERVLMAIDEHPEWRQINARHQRNEGYQKSIDEEKTSV